MDKAEELKAKILSFQKERIKMFIKTKDIFYQAVKKPLIITNKEELDDYAQQVSREVAEKAFNYGYDAQISHRSFNEFWDNWIKNQQ